MRLTGSLFFIFFQRIFHCQSECKTRSGHKHNAPRRGAELRSESFEVFPFGRLVKRFKSKANVWSIHRLNLIDSHNEKNNKPVNIYNTIFTVSKPTSSNRKLCFFSPTDVLNYCFRPLSSIVELNSLPLLRPFRGDLIQ